MKEILRQSLIGKRFKTSTGEVSPVITDVRMVHMKESDTPANDWWGREWDELCVIFEDSQHWKSPIPITDTLKYEVI